MNTEQKQAIQLADDYTNMAGLPSYSELLAALREFHAAAEMNEPPSHKAMQDAAAILARAGGAA